MNLIYSSPVVTISVPLYSHRKILPEKLEMMTLLS